MIKLRILRWEDYLGFWEVPNVITKVLNRREAGGLGLVVGDVRMEATSWVMWP